MSEPRRAGDHQRLLVGTAGGERLEVDHNVRLAPWVPAGQGDTVTVRGRLYVDPDEVGVHCTHRETSRGCPQPGWIELHGTHYD